MGVQIREKGCDGRRGGGHQVVVALTSIRRGQADSRSKPRSVERDIATNDCIPSGPKLVLGQSRDR